MDSQRFLEAVTAAPECTDPSPELRQRIHQALKCGDETQVLELIRDYVRDTQRGILARLVSG